MAADDDQLETRLLGDPLQSRRAHLPRRSDGEPIAGNDEGFAAVNPLPEIRHEVAECARFPALVERVEAFGNAIRGGGNLVGVDRVELLLLAKDFQVPEDQRLTANERTSCRRRDG